MRRTRHSGVVGLLGLGSGPTIVWSDDKSISLHRGGDPFIAFRAQTSRLAAWECSGRPSKSRHTQEEDEILLFSFANAFRLATFSPVAPSCHPSLALALMQSYHSFALNLTSTCLDNVKFNPALPILRQARKYTVHVQ